MNSMQLLFISLILIPSYAFAAIETQSALIGYISIVVVLPAVILFSILYRI